MGSFFPQTSGVPGRLRLWAIPCACRQTDRQMLGYHCHLECKVRAHFTMCSCTVWSSTQHFRLSRTCLYTQDVFLLVCVPHAVSGHLAMTVTVGGLRAASLSLPSWVSLGQSFVSLSHHLPICEMGRRPCSQRYCGD